jgi:protein-disulfide isomerase
MAVTNEPIARLAVPVNSHDHAQGPPDAPVTLVEYGDFECPDCGNAYPILRRIQKEMGRRLRFVFRHFPRYTIHPHAGIAAQAAEAAAAQGKFWEMHALLFEHQQDLTDSDMVRYALRIGLEPYRFEADLSSQVFAGRVEADYDGGVRSGVKGTPTFFITGERYSGPREYEPLKRAIEGAERGEPRGEPRAKR